MILGKLPPGLLPPGKFPPGLLPPGLLPPGLFPTGGLFPTRKIPNPGKFPTIGINSYHFISIFWVTIKVSRTSLNKEKRLKRYKKHQNFLNLICFCAYYGI